MSNLIVNNFILEHPNLKHKEAVRQLKELYDIDIEITDYCQMARKLGIIKNNKRNKYKGTFEQALEDKSRRCDDGQS